jgi:hypothetical protein
VAGLVLRRQLHLLCSIRGFIATFLVALPLGALIAERETHWAAGAGVYVWAYTHAGHVESLRRTVWQTGDTGLVHLLSWALLNAATLVTWSCAAGWALGVFARRGVWFSVAAFYGVVVLVSSIRGGIGSLPGHPAFAAFGFVAIATAVHGAVLVIAPALWALRRSLDCRPVRKPAAALFAFTTALLTYRAMSL